MVNQVTRTIEEAIFQNSTNVARPTNTGNISHDALVYEALRCEGAVTTLRHQAANHRTRLAELEGEIIQIEKRAVQFRTAASVFKGDDGS